MRKMKKWVIGILCMNLLFCSACGSLNAAGYMEQLAKYSNEAVEWMGKAENCVSINDIPEYDGNPFVIINDNKPSFTENEITTVGYEEYSELDYLGRCGAAEACIGKEIMPTEDREPIGQVRPTGWQTAKYDFVDGKYLYNRCHLIGFQLAGENANEKNLITGTRYFNVDEMLPFENMVAEYVKETGNHVMYRVTPIFEGTDLLAKGVEMEAYSVEDQGEAISFHVFCYNVQPGVIIDYATGYNWLDGQIKTSETEKETYILNANTHKYHLPSCESVKKMAKSNRKKFTGTRKELEKVGYEPCGNCIGK